MMACEERFFDENYLDRILNPADVPLLPPEGDLARCLTYLGGQYYLGMERLDEGYESFVYRQLPVLYGVADNQAVMEEAGIGPLTRRTEPLTGADVLIAVIDTGINYEHPAFRRGGETTIWSAWDQTDREGPPPEGFSYGRGYSREEIRQALEEKIALPLNDPLGHGTFTAGVAAGQPSQDFTGAAYGADLIIVKLKPAKENLRRFYGAEDVEAAYSSSDIMLGIRYARQVAEEAGRPLVILLALSTNLGSHANFDPLEDHLNNIADQSGLIVVTPAGNEGGAARHFSGELPRDEEVEFLIGQGETAVMLTLWGQAPNRIRVGLTSPAGHVLEPVPLYLEGLWDYAFPLESSRIFLRYYAPSVGSGDPGVYLRIQDPAPGLWRLRLESEWPEGGPYQIWLPLRSWSREDTRFLRPDPFGTVTAPGTAARAITAGGYNWIQDSLYENTGRGDTRDRQLKPSFAAPATEVFGPVGTENYRASEGTSGAAAITAGGAALMMEYALKRNQVLPNTIVARNQMIRGAIRRLDLDYPNREWGYGQLDVEGALEI